MAAAATAIIITTPLITPYGSHQLYHHPVTTDPLPIRPPRSSPPTDHLHLRSTSTITTAATHFAVTSQPRCVATIFTPSSLPRLNRRCQHPRGCVGFSNNTNATRVRLVSVTTPGGSSLRESLVFLSDSGCVWIAA
nr:hypothetical protein [Tanacetum cinerariifolium]